MRSLIISLTILASFSALSEAKVTDCGGPKAISKLVSVSVSGCDLESEAACSLVQGQNVKMEVDFETAAAFTSATVDVKGKILAIPLPFPISPSEACGNYGFDCPVEANETKKFSITMPIQKFYPKLSVNVQLKLSNEIGKPIFCVEFPAKVVAGQ